MRRLAFVLLASCTVPSTGSTDQPIIGGALAPSDSATVLLVSYPAARTAR